MGESVNNFIAGCCKKRDEEYATPKALINRNVDFFNKQFLNGVKKKIFIFTSVDWLIFCFIHVHVLMYSIIFVTCFSKGCRQDIGSRERKIFQTCYTGHP